MAVNMAGRSSISAGLSLLQVSQTKKKVCSTVNERSLAQTAAARRDLLLQLEKNIVEQMISKGTAGKKRITSAAAKRTLIRATSSRSACA